ncbi:MAG TPA: glutamine synthetase III [Thermovirgaceae bacterium]|nr:glutamine synthetase III [Thermovirgaceae bacterium]
MRESPAKTFGSNVFNDRAMRERLPKHVYQKLQEAISGGEKMDFHVAEIVATAIKEWAVSCGATHYTHWFHPRTDLTAEKHMAFLTIDEHGIPLDSFGGADLIQSEPDASSLPSGGMRSTFEARGYTAWDPTSPAFVVPAEHGGTLCIPSVFISNDGTPLDMKTPLLRALSRIENISLRVLKLFGNRSVKWTRATMGAEQEFFLIDESCAVKRPDIQYCGRTLLGAPTPKGQQMEDHYFGSIPSRVLAFMQDVDKRMCSLGMVLKTRHNEVAPCQFEFAPQFTEANLAVDQNQILMEQMRQIASSHGFRLMLHEKPFALINGSGKHLNFSLMDSEGRNLLKTSSSQRKNIQFLTLVSALLLGISRYGGLLRASVATPGNMRRLGGNEAPPSIMSVFLGDVLSGIFERVEEGIPENMPSKAFIDLGLNRLPDVLKDNTDRNRTAPIAFTGNKFEFRAPGSSQSPAGPMTMLLSMWAWGMEELANMIESRIGETDVADAALDAIRYAAMESRNIRFEGNCYSPEWHDEAQKRGLPIAHSTPEALALFLVPEHRELLSKLGIFTEREIEGYYETRLEQYVKTLDIEMNVMESMVRNGILPAISSHITSEGTALAHVPESARAGSSSHWQEHIEELYRMKERLLDGVAKMASLRNSLSSLDLEQRASVLTEKAIPLMDGIRGMCDASEVIVSTGFWPYPTYCEMLMGK